MPLDPAVLDVAELAYQAAVEPDLWSAVVKRTAGLFGAEKSIVLTLEGSGASGTMASGFPVEAFDLYFRHYERLNPVQEAIKAKVGTGAARPLVTTDQSWVDKSDYEATEFYNDFGRRFAIHASLLIWLGGPTLNALRPRSRGDFDSVELATAAAVQRPLARAFALSRRLAEERRGRDGLVEWLAGAAGPLIAADARGRVTYASPAAEALLRAADGLSVRSGELVAATPAATRRVHQAIAGAAQAGIGAGVSAPRPSGRRPYALMITPARSGFGGEGERLALISISDPEPYAPAAERLTELFGLTPGEARVVAQLAAGYATHAIAERLGVSFHTVRVQLARALDKTETRRQAELVALVIRALGRLN